MSSQNGGSPGRRNCQRLSALKRDSRSREYPPTRYCFLCWIGRHPRDTSSRNEQPPRHAAVDTVAVWLRAVETPETASGRDWTAENIGAPVAASACRMTRTQAPELLPIRQFDTMDVKFRAATRTCPGLLARRLPPPPAAAFNRRIGSFKMSVFTSPIQVRLTLALNKSPK